MVPAQQGGPPVQQQAGFAPPSPPPPGPAPQGGPYAPQGGVGPGPSPYAPQGGPQAPYSPHPMQPPQGYPMPPQGGRRSSKGLAIGLGVGAVAVAGAIVAGVMISRGGGGGGAGSRDDLVKRALAAMAEGDVEKLVKLSDPVGLYDLALDCSEREKAKQDQEKDGAKDKDVDKDKDADKDAGSADKAADKDAGSADTASDRAKDADDDIDVDPHIQEKRVRRQHERLVEKTKGLKLELVSVADKADANANAKDDAKDDAKDKDAADGARKKDRGVMKKGDKAMKGCVVKVDVQLHDLVAKVRVTEADGKETSEREARLVALEAGGSWYLFAAPTLAGGSAAIAAELRKYRDQMCACKDVACADDVHKAMKDWGKTVLDAVKSLPKDEMKPLDEIDEEMKACRNKLREAAESDDTKQALAKMEELKDKMCSCTDASCAAVVQRELTDWSASMTGKASKPGSDDDMKRASDLMKAYVDCSTKAMASDAAPTPPDDPLPPEEPAAGAKTASASGLASLPACAEYRRQIDRLKSCPKYPPSTADTIRQGWQQMEKMWPAARADATRRQSMNRACASIVDALKKAFDKTCP